MAWPLRAARREPKSENRGVWIHAPRRAPLAVDGEGEATADAPLPWLLDVPLGGGGGHTALAPLPARLSQQRPHHSAPLWPATLRSRPSRRATRSATSWRAGAWISGGAAGGPVRRNHKCAISTQSAATAVRDVKRRPLAAPPPYNNDAPATHAHALGVACHSNDTHLVPGDWQPPGRLVTTLPPRLPRPFHRPSCEGPPLPSARSRHARAIATANKFPVAAAWQCLFFTLNTNAQAKPSSTCCLIGHI